MATLSAQNQFKTILRNSFQDKFYTGLLHGSILSSLLDIMEFSSVIIEDLETSGASPAVACHSGCCYCCYSHLKIIPMEALLILSFIETNFGDKRRARLKEKIIRNQRLKLGKTIEEQFQLKKKMPCVFLENDTCSIYPVRPLICRSWNSFDEDDCKSAFFSDTYHAKIESSSARNFVFGMASALLIELGLQLKLQSSKLEMTAAVCDCMTLNDPMALWLAGYKIVDTDAGFEDVDESMTHFYQETDGAGQTRESSYVGYFYEKYQGRIALGVGYDQDFSQVYPFIFQTIFGRPIGIVAMGVVDSEIHTVHIYHIGSFISSQGDGSLILEELCRKADCFDVQLSVSPVYMPNGKDPQMEYDRLSEWYGRFNFKGDSSLIRLPRGNVAGV